jgi:hypothetical protein
VRDPRGAFACRDRVIFACGDRLIFAYGGQVIFAYGEHGHLPWRPPVDSRSRK